MPSVNKWKVKRVKLDKLIPMPDNPRTIDESALAGLTSSFLRFGCVEPIVWNEKTGHVLGGHQRLSILKNMECKDAMVMVCDFTEQEEAGINLTLNNPEIEGEWDEPLNQLLSHLKESSAHLYGELRLGNLEHAVSQQDEVKGTGPEELNREIDIDDLMDSCDTGCPCCGFKWMVDSRDVTVEEVN